MLSAERSRVEANLSSVTAVRQEQRLQTVLSRERRLILKMTHFVQA